MAVWFMRWLQGVLCGQSSLFDVDMAAFGGSTRKPANDHRDDALSARARAHALHLPKRSYLKGALARRYHHEGRNA
jgi:hypothetical protein